MVEFLFNLPALIGHFIFNLAIWSLVIYMIYRSAKETYDIWKEQ